MKKSRAGIAGMTDYSGYSLPDCIEHLEDWSCSTAEVIGLLASHLRELRGLGSGYIFEVASDFERNSIDFLRRINEDLERLMEELPRGMTQAHIELLDQLLKGVDLKHKSCLSFQHSYVHADIENKAVYRLMDRLYGDMRGMLFDYDDLANLRYRLKTFVGLPVASKGVAGTLDDSVEIKPSLFGVSIDAKRILKGICGMLRGSRRKVTRNRSRKEKP